MGLYHQLDSFDKLLQKCTLRLVSTGNNLRRQGTGFFIAPNIILTTAHILGDEPQDDASVQAYWVHEDRDKPEPFETKRLSIPSYDKIISNNHIIIYPDLLLLEILNFTHKHYCVRLRRDTLFESGTKCHSFTYPVGGPIIDVKAETLDFELTGNAFYDDNEKQKVIKLGKENITTGHSGAPALEILTGYVCGMIQRTKHPLTDFGGKAIPSHVIWENLTDEIRASHDLYHKENPIWELIPLKKKIEESSAHRKQFNVCVQDDLDDNENKERFANANIDFIRYVNEWKQLLPNEPLPDDFVQVLPRESFEKRLHKIDFVEIISDIDSLKTRMNSFAFLVAENDVHDTKRPDLLVRRIKEHYIQDGWVIHHLSPTSISTLTPDSLYKVLAQHYPNRSSNVDFNDVWDVIVAQLSQEPEKSIFLLQLSITSKFLDSDFFNFFLNSFWNPLRQKLDEEISIMDVKSKKQLLAFLICDAPIPEGIKLDTCDRYAQSENRDEYYISISINNWGEQDIFNWLQNEIGIVSDISQSIAQKIIEIASKKGKPHKTICEHIYRVFKNQLDERNQNDG